MDKNPLRFVCILVLAACAGCVKEVVVEVPAGHVGLVCSKDEGPESCGFWLHDPGKLTIREDEKLRLMDCAPFVRTDRVTAKTRDGVEVEVRSDAAYEVVCRNYETRQAFRLVDGDIGADALFANYGRPGLDDALQLASTTYLSAELDKEPERLRELASAIVRRTASASGPLALKKFEVASVSLKAPNGEPRSIYDKATQ